ncbi:MAG: carbon-nitrogen hydrolase family protein [Verrucomicrobiota bacterium]
MKIVRRFALFAAAAGIALLTAGHAAAQTTTIRVALCQIFCVDGDRAGNFVRMENALAEARQKGADLACFPECAVLGWVNPDAHRRAYPIPGPDSDRLCELAKKYRMHVCAGLDEKDGTNLYDTAVLISDEGKLLLKHHKMHNLDNDHLIEPPYTSGHDIRAVDTKLGRIGLLICADTFIDDFLRKMADLKPGLVLVPYGWVGAENDWPGHGQNLVNVVRHAAEVIGAPVVGTDSVGEVTHGPWAGRTYGGFSNVSDRRGQTLAVAKDRDRDVLIVPIEVGR